MGSAFTVEFYQNKVTDEEIGDEAADHLSQFRYSAHRRNKNQKLVRANMSYASVLVVDDVVANLEVARGMLKPYKLYVECVTSGTEAVKRVREEKVYYDAIFMDHMMPDIDGLEAVRRIREEIGSDYAKKVPVIALTANAIQGSDSMFLEHGFQAYLSKPIDILRLDQVLNQWIRNKTKEKELPPEDETANDEKKPSLFRSLHIPGLNTNNGLARFENDEPSYLRVLRAYVKHTVAFVETAKNAGSDLDAYRIAVHSIKGSGRGIGAEKLIETLNDFLKTIPDDSDDENKPEKEDPDPELISALKKAAEDFDIKALYNAIDLLDTYQYSSHPELVKWLKQKAGVSDFISISKNIESF